MGMKPFEESMTSRFQSSMSSRPFQLVAKGLSERIGTCLTCVHMCVVLCRFYWCVRLCACSFCIIPMCRCNYCIYAKHSSISVHILAGCRLGACVVGMFLAGCPESCITILDQRFSAGLDPVMRWILKKLKSPRRCCHSCFPGCKVPLPSVWQQPPDTTYFILLI